MSSNNINGAEVSKNKDNNYNINSVNNKKNNGSKNSHNVGSIILHTIIKKK